MSNPGRGAAYLCPVEPEPGRKRPRSAAPQRNLRFRPWRMRFGHGRGGYAGRCSAEPLPQRSRTVPCHVRAARYGRRPPDCGCSGSRPASRRAGPSCPPPCAGPGVDQRRYNLPHCFRVCRLRPRSRRADGRRVPDGRGIVMSLACVGGVRGCGHVRQLCRTTAAVAVSAVPADCGHADRAAAVGADQRCPPTGRCRRAGVRWSVQPAPVGAPELAAEPRETAPLQPVHRRHTTVSFAGAGIGGRGAVALQHDAGLPAGDAHEVHLAAALGEPRMREGVPEPVGT
jgi:hypothetical protein